MKQVFTLEEVIAILDNVQDKLQFAWLESLQQEQDKDYRDGLRAAQDMVYNEVISIINEK